MSGKRPYPVLTPEEAVQHVNHGDTVAFSGFGAAGTAKVFPRALAEKAGFEHRNGREFKVRVLTGASSGKSVDEALAAARAISWRAPYQSDPTLRKQINRQEVEYVDMHLSHLPQSIAEGFLGRIDLAVVEATEITADGRVFLTTSIGASPTVLQQAEKVIIEINGGQPERLRELADIVVMPLPNLRNPIPIQGPLDRIGLPYATVNPNKVIGIVSSHEPDKAERVKLPDETVNRIAKHLAGFLLSEISAGRIPPGGLPLQAGVGAIGDGVMAGLGGHPDFPPFTMYTEVFQESLVDLMLRERLTAASATGLVISWEGLSSMIDHFDLFARRLVLRPQEISNHPAVIRRLGVIAMNTALEVDIYGNVNSSHLFGTDVVNGIGGSGEFTRNSYLSIFMTPSVAKGKKISSIVPMCPHVDSNEHSVQVIVTEQGVADLRGKGPLQRARQIIDNTAHPLYRDYLRRYLHESRSGHIPHDLLRCFELHRNFLECGAMLPDLKLE